MNDKNYVEEVCSKCENKLNDKDLCDIRTTINGKLNCVNFKEKTNIRGNKKMIKEVGTTENDKLTFLNLSFSGNINTGEIDIVVELDNRLIKLEQTAELEKLTRKFLNGVNKIMEQNK